MKSETLITISSYKHQLCSGEVSGLLFLNLARFQNYQGTTSHSLDSLFDFTSFFKGSFIFLQYSRKWLKVDVF